MKKVSFIGVAALAAIFSFTITSTVQAAADPAVKCEAGKLKEAGKYANCRMNADSKAVKKDEDPDYQMLNQVEERLEVPKDTAEDFRKAVISNIAGYAIEHPGKNLQIDRIFHSSATSTLVTSSISMCSFFFPGLSTASCRFDSSAELCEIKDSTKSSSNM